jgi:outer membrane protein TolC
VSKQRQLGEATELASAATQLELAEARRDLRQAHADLATQRRALNRLLGLPAGYGLNVAGFGEPLTVVVLDDLADEELERRLLTGRPELAAKAAAYERSEQELRVAVIGQYPRLGLGPAFERELGGEKSLGIGLSLELPIFDRNQGEIAGKRAARDRVRAEYTALLHGLRADAFEARSAVRAARAEVEAQEKDILPLLRRNDELFEGAYRTRELNIIDFLTAQERGLRARREYLAALVAYRKAVIELDIAAGRAGRAQ